ncbi:MAG: NDP-sugar synthase [Actinomycetota bacterium]|nr:NDP-sugar synthase [Actinomycetota bacterium]MDA3015486.1 NDP-sugar synthase [Actinomycetota bacterium]MDA3029187.1 NDP-sugar synthase [Actinomycetota bacterium]
MHAVVLVGGFGTRLRPLTNDVPKPMLPVGNRPMIVRLAERLAAGGVTDIVLALGFKPDVFRAAFPGDVVAGPSGPVRLHYAVEPEPLDTAGAIRFAADAAGIDGTFVVANGDIMTSLEISSLVDFHRERGVEATIHLTPVADPSAFGVVEVGSDGKVLRFVEKPAPGETESNTINAGTYVFEPSVLDRIEPGRRVSVERETFPALVADGALAAVATNDSWIDTGRPELYRAANLDLIQVEGEAVVIAASAVIDPSADVVNSVIGEGVTIGSGATVIDSVILPGARIGAHARIEASLVWGAVADDVALTECVIGRDAVVSGGPLSGRRIPEPD